MREGVKKEERSSAMEGGSIRDWLTGGRLSETRFEEEKKKTRQARSISGGSEGYSQTRTGRGPRKVVTGKGGFIRRRIVTRSRDSRLLKDNHRRREWVTWACFAESCAVRN